MKTTYVGYINKNNQKNLGYRGPSETHVSAKFYEMECLDCGHKYMANGCDVWLRKCPNCQDDSNAVKRKVEQEIIAALAHTKMGTVLSSTEIKQMVYDRFGRNKSSVIPSDYCYNRLNFGIDYHKNVHLFEFLENGKYTYLGIDFPYNGKLYNKTKGSEREDIVGEVVGGTAFFFDTHQSDVTNETQKEKVILGIHKTKREISVQLRYKVLKRDNFKCCACGASPAKDSSVELHIDHIIPWSKGGETVLENLQTLCSQCNIGKSDTE